MQNTLKDQDSTISIECRLIVNLRFVDDMHLIVGSYNKLQKHNDSLAYRRI